MNRLKYYRQKKGITQQELAIKSKISRITICGIERKGPKNITINTMLALSKALDIPVKDIFLS